MTEDKDKKLEEIIEQNAQEKITINIPKKQEQPAPQIKEFEDIDSGDDVVIEEQVLDEQADEQQLEQPKHIKPKSKGFNTAIIALIIVGCSIISSIIGLGILNDVLALYKQDIDIIIVIPKNASTGQISQILKDNKIINLEFAFRIVSRLNKADGTYQYGEYTLNPRMSYPTIISKLQKPAVKRETVRVALIEGTSIVKMAMILEDNGVCTAKDFLDIANRENFGFDFEKEISNNPLKFQRVEGFIMPDTYEFYINDSPYNVAKKIFSRFNDKFSADLKDRMKQLGMTLEETIIFASIVQNEAPVLSEMKKVAGVEFSTL
jgi:UPF0755 protein